MAVRPEEAKAALVEKAIAHVHERLPGPQAGDVERFVRSYYAVRSERVDGRTGDSHAVGDACAFTVERLDAMGWCAPRSRP
jgi:hypothetical protein